MSTPSHPPRPSTALPARAGTSHSPVLKKMWQEGRRRTRCGEGRSWWRAARHPPPPAPEPFHSAPKPIEPPREGKETEFFIDSLLVPVHCIIVMIRSTGLGHGGLSFLFQVAVHLWGGHQSRGPCSCRSGERETTGYEPLELVTYASKGS